jgi:hypothetical protein
MTIEQFKNRITLISRLLAQKSGDFLFLGGKYAEGAMKFRIFNEGRATDGGAIGAYKSKSWIKKRSETGRQVGKVDLEFTGDLRNSIQVVKDGREVVIAIINDEKFIIAKGQEDRRKKDIFLPTDEEVKEVEQYVAELIDAELEKIIASL